MGACDKLERARAVVKAADAVVVTAGAGMGVDSGLPDFRGNEGFWRAYPPFAKLGLSFVELANPRWFSRDPALAWGFYGHRKNLYADVSPHRGFALLLAYLRSRPRGGFVFTSNVDGQFQKAGFEDLRIVECHGNIHHLQCLDPRCDGGIWPSSERVTVDLDSMRAVAPYPACRHCGKMARPNILMFGDGGWRSERTDMQELRLGRYLDELASARAKPVVIECGAGTAIPTVRRFSEQVAKKLGGTLIRINPRESEGPAGTLSFATGAVATLEPLLAPWDLGERRG
jgi:NAD-dependent SIR2 family protein deacetylase